MRTGVINLRYEALAVAVVVVVGAAIAASELEVGFYDWSCPEAMDIVQRGVHEAMLRDPRMPASLLRLHFHDCFVNVSCTLCALCDLHLHQLKLHFHFTSNVL